MIREFRLLLLLGLLSAALGCTATRTREFTRETYTPAREAAPVVRVFAAEPASLREALGEELSRRGAVFEEAGPGELLAIVPWAHPAEKAASLALGEVRIVVTQTERAYRSWSPLDLGCTSCVVRNGSLVGQETQLLQDETQQVLVKTGRNYVPETQFRNMAAFLQGDVDLTDSLSLHAGARQEHAEQRRETQAARLERPAKERAAVLPVAMDPDR